MSEQPELVGVEYPETPLGAPPTGYFNAIIPPEYRGYPRGDIQRWEPPQTVAPQITVVIQHLTVVNQAPTQPWDVPQLPAPATPEPAQYAPTVTDQVRYAPARRSSNGDGASAVAALVLVVAVLVSVSVFMEYLVLLAAVLVTVVGIGVLALIVGSLRGGSGRLRLHCFGCRR